MKHLRKKYIRSVQLDQQGEEILANTSVDEKFVSEIKLKSSERYFGILQTKGNELIQTFNYENDGKTYFIPEPDPIVIYFDLGRHYLNSITEFKIELFENLTSSNSNAFQITNKFYSYFSVCSAFVVFIFLSIEALINKIIP